MEEQQSVTDDRNVRSTRILNNNLSLKCECLTAGTSVKHNFIVGNIKQHKRNVRVRERVSTCAWSITLINFLEYVKRV